MENINNKQIIEHAKTLSIDLDGDIVSIDGVKYFVHVLKNIVERID